MEFLKKCQDKTMINKRVQFSIVGCGFGKGFGDGFWCLTPSMSESISYFNKALFPGFMWHREGWAP